jgi:hypothetical protein
LRRIAPDCAGLRPSCADPRATRAERVDPRHRMGDRSRRPPIDARLARKFTLNISAARASESLPTVIGRRAMRPHVSFAVMRYTIPILGMLLVVAAGSAFAQTRPTTPMPPQPLWDSRGWVQLGERTVNGRVDHDRIEVGHAEGKFNKLTMVVENSDLQLLDFKIVFADRTEYHPRLEHVFREGQRTRAIDLPPSEGVIRHIELRYKNLSGGGDARVQIWGWRTGGATPPPAAPPSPPAPPPAAPRHSWDTRGWTLLGQRQVNGRADHDRIEVGRQEGRFSKLTMAVEDSDLELLDFRIEFDDRTEYRPRLSHLFKEGQRTRVIDLPPSEHVIRFIDIRYRNTPGGGPASVEVWGQRAGGATPPPPPAAPAWDPKGWTLLGERTVDGRVDRDRITVGKYEGKFTKLMLVVDDSDLELIDFSVQFARGAAWRPSLTHYFREGQRTRALDFPGDERTIRHIDFRYRNLPGGGRAKVAVYGMRDNPAWDAKGWTMLGEQRVDGRREDTDRIRVSRWERRFRKLTVVVLDSDLELIDMSIKFGRGEPFHPELNATFREGSRARVIDLPGDNRAIQWIEFKYRNLPGGGPARVQVWAK